jgi:hypothetical protein
VNVGISNAVLLRDYLGGLPQREDEEEEEKEDRNRYLRVMARATGSLLVSTLWMRRSTSSTLSTCAVSTGSHWRSASHTACRTKLLLHTTRAHNTQHDV